MFYRTANVLCQVSFAFGPMMSQSHSCVTKLTIRSVLFGAEYVFSNELKHAVRIYSLDEHLPRCKNKTCPLINETEKSSGVFPCLTELHEMEYFRSHAHVYGNHQSDLGFKFLWFNYAFCIQLVLL